MYESGITGSVDFSLRSLHFFRDIESQADLKGFVYTVHLFAADTPDIAHHAALVDGFDLLQKNDRCPVHALHGGKADSVWADVASCLGGLSKGQQ